MSIVMVSIYGVVMWESRRTNRRCGIFFFFRTEDAIHDLMRSRGVGDMCKREGRERERERESLFRSPDAWALLRPLRPSRAKRGALPGPRAREARPDAPDSRTWQSPTQRM